MQEAVQPERRRANVDIAHLWRTARGPLIAVLSILISWELLARSGRFVPILLPDVTTVARTFVRIVTDGTLPYNTLVTLVRMNVGYFIAVALGVTAGLLMGRVRFFEEFGGPLVAFMLPIPSLALVPLFTVWFGLGAAPAIILVVFVATPPVALNTWTGVRSIDPVLIRAGRAMGVRNFELFRKVILPAAFPGILTGLRFGLAIAWRAIIAGELISATETGLGWMLFDAREWLRADVMFGTLFVMALLGITIEKFGFALIDRYTVEKWGMVSRESDKHS